MTLPATDIGYLTLQAVIFRRHALGFWPRFKHGCAYCKDCAVAEKQGQRASEWLNFVKGYSTNPSQRFYLCVCVTERVSERDGHGMAFSFYHSRRRRGI